MGEDSIERETKTKSAKRKRFVNEKKVKSKEVKNFTGGGKKQKQKSRGIS